VTPPAARSRYSFPVLIALAIVNHSVLAGSRVTVSLYALSIGASPLVVGTLMGLYAFLPIWLSVAAGRLSDRVGVRGPMLVGSFGVALGAALPCIWPGIGALFAATSLIGASFMLFQVSVQNATGEMGPPGERAKNFSLLALGYSISGFCGPLAAGLSIDHLGFGTTFIGFALLPLLPVLVLTRRALVLPGRHRAHAQAPSGGIMQLMRNPQLKRVFIVNALLSMAWDLHTFFIPIYGATIGLSASRIGVILAAMAPMGALSAVLITEPPRSAQYAASAAAAGVDPAADQRAAAVVMWVGGGLVITVAVLVLAGVALWQEEVRMRRREAVGTR